MIAYIPPMVTPRRRPRVNLWPIVALAVAAWLPVVLIWAAVRLALAHHIPIFTAGFAMVALCLLAFGFLSGIAVAEEMA
jgi:hypothetical protein